MKTILLLEKKNSSGKKGKDVLEKGIVCDEPLCNYYKLKTEIPIYQ